MAYQDEEQNMSQQAQNIADAAKATSSSVRAIGKAAVGDMAGAAIEVITNKTLRNAVIASLLLFSLLITGVGMFLGSSITGAAENLIQKFEENYDEAWIQHGVASNGSTLYMFSFSQSQVALEAVGTTIGDVLSSVATNIVNGTDATNQSLPDADVYDADDAQQTLEALKTEEAMTGAIKRRLDMIKSRVAQRGAQIQTAATFQYSWQAIGNATAVVLRNYFSNPLLFAGIDFDSCSISVNTDAFKLTDTQALKILCAFSIQHDTTLESTDMWSLMNYCGWYSSETSELPAAHLAEASIYKSSDVAVSMGGGIDGIIGSGADMTGYLSETSYFSALTVPYWSGTFVPQWVLEEKAQIQKHNDHYWELVENEDAISPEDYKWGIQATKDSEITGFEKLDAVEPYGIIDKLFQTSTAQITITPVEFHGYSEIPRELLNGLWQELIDQWETTFAPQETNSYTDSLGNYITGNSITYYTAEGTYILRYNGSMISSKTASGGSVCFGGLAPGTQYKLYRKTPIGSAYTYKHILTFTTASTSPQPYAESFQLDIDVEVAFSALSIDELISNTIGLWEGSLYNVVETQTGIYQSGEEENELLLYQWTDTFTNEAGETKEITFKRQHGYQAEAYRDNVLALGKEVLPEDEYRTLTSISGLSAGLGSGQDLVAIAQAEYESNHGIYSGDKYWFARCDYYGTSHSNLGAWCVCFVYYCAYQSGYLTDEGCFGSEWRTLVSNSWNYFREQGRVYTSPDYVPEAGDLIYFGHDPSQNGQSFTHIGIVEYVEGGTVHTIEGNYSRTVSKRSADYRVGTLAGDAYIEGYAKPNYPASSAADYLFMTLPGPLQPSVTAVLLGEGASEAVLAGIPRFTPTQIRTFVNQLSTQDPDFALLPEVSALATAVQSNAKNAELADAWNAVATSYPEEFESLQIEYAVENILTPAYQQCLNRKNFNWGKSTARMDILWAVCTVSPYTGATTQILMELTEGLKDSATDWEVTQNYIAKIQSIIDNYSASLWRGYDDQTREQWAKTLTDLNPLFEEQYPEQTFTGDPTKIKDEIFSFLVNEVGLNNAAACGILANIEEESGFDLSAWGDVNIGGSYGLFQWFGRKNNLFAYCKAHELDAASLEGQLRFMQYELETSFNSVYKKILAVPNTAEGARQAAYDWCVYYEIPENRFTRGIARGNIAVSTYWPKYK